MQKISLLIISLTITAYTLSQNRPPIAKVQFVVNLPCDSVVLSAATCAPDGPITKYEWSQVAGPDLASAPTRVLHAKPGGRSFILKSDAQGYLVINNSAGTYKPGDTLCLSGVFKSVAIYNLSGAFDNYIVVTNIPGQTLIIGDSTWSGGAWAQGLVFRGCRYLEVAGTGKNFKIVGSNSEAKDANGYPVRTAYYDLLVGELSDNFIVHDITIRHGGCGVWAKTEVIPGKPATWYPNTYLNNFEFYNLDIGYTYNEGMYIGHTASYWNVRTNQPYYPGPGSTVQNDTATYKRPVKLRNVKIHDNFIHDIGNDGIQTAAIDNLELYNNEVTNWATKKSYGDCGGILIGGRVKGFKVHDNQVYDGWGELLQVYAEGGAEATINNNLLVRNKLDGVSFRGTDNLQVTCSNNTIAYVGGNLVRINGYYGGTKVTMTKNVLAEPLSGSSSTIYAKNYVYLENGGQATDADNKKLASGVEIVGAVGYGFTDIKPVVLGSAVIVSPNSATTVVRGLSAGDYIFRLNVVDQKGAGSGDEIRVVVK